MLTDLLPIMDATVRHYQLRRRSIHGGRQPLIEFTEHPAKVVRSIGAMPAPASRENKPLPSATVWLINHPHRIAVGHVIELAPGEPLDVIGVEVRQAGIGTLTKVSLK